MPSAPDSITALGIARKERPNLIVITASHPLLRDQVLAAGARAFFQKPPDQEKLLAAIHELA